MANDYWECASFTIRKEKKRSKKERKEENLATLGQWARVELEKRLLKVQKISPSCARIRALRKKVMDIGSSYTWWMKIISSKRKREGKPAVVIEVKYHSTIREVHCENKSIESLEKQECESDIIG